MVVSCFGRQRSTPGSGENVAVASLMTVAFTRLASRAAGKRLTDFFQAQVDDFLPRLLQQIIGCADDQLEVLAGCHIGAISVPLAETP